MLMSVPSKVVLSEGKEEIASLFFVGLGVAVAVKSPVRTCVVVTVIVPVESSGFALELDMAELMSEEALYRIPLTIAPF